MEIKVRKTGSPKVEAAPEVSGRLKAFYQEKFQK
jgi:hypothetical protein